MLTVTTCTPDYPRPWIFPSLGMVRGRVVCLLDPADRRPLPVNAERVSWQADGYEFQDGRFLDALPGLADDDLVVLADADGVFQRDWAPDELAALGDLREGFALGYNVRPGQRGAEEYALLRPKQYLAGGALAVGLPEAVLAGCWVYNTGLMAARVSAWRRLRELYAPLAGKGAGLFLLHSWPQLLLCATLHLHGIPVAEMGYEVHSQGHFPLTRAHRVDRRRLYYGEKLVLFAHNCVGVSH